MPSMFVYNPPKKRSGNRKKSPDSCNKKAQAPKKKPSVPSPQPTANAARNPTRTPMNGATAPQYPYPYPQHQQAVQFASPYPVYQQAPPYPSHAPLQPRPGGHPYASVPANKSSAALAIRNGKEATKTKTKKSSGKDLVKLAKAASTADLNKTFVKPLQGGIDDVQQLWKQRTAEVAYNGDIIAAKFNAILTSIDGEMFSGREEDLHIVQRSDSDPNIRGGGDLARSTGREASRAVDQKVCTAVTSPKTTNVFAKVNLYANSMLPPWLPPLKLYLPSYPLICLAAQFSERVYSNPTGKEKETHVDADWRMGTKAMVIKSVPMDDVNAIVISIRGSQTFMDWAVNLNSEPSSPQGFLDDAGNLCHSGFLSVARKMIKPVAARLRSLLEEDPSRSTCSLIMTGHSAGGAVASLLYAHMLAEVQRSELNILTGCFKRIHCITFGAPPISLLPIFKPRSERYKKSMFLSFINEGDPVPRADKPYVRSLLDLYKSPAPKPITFTETLPPAAPPKNKTNAFTALLKPSRPKLPKAQSVPTNCPSVAVWNVPPCTLSNAGRCVVLRPRPRVPGSQEAGPGGNGNGGGQGEEDVVAQIVTDEEMRGVVFGDPVMHMMRVYRRRVEVLATKAVIGGSSGWT